MRRLFLLLLTAQCTWTALGESKFEPYHVHKSIVTFSPTVEDRAYFGFSVSTFKLEDKLRIVASAPRHGRVGKLFDCDINIGNCTTIPDPEYLVSKAKDIEKTQYEYHKFWLGATVKGIDDAFVACAPLSLRITSCSSTTASETSYATYGDCFKYLNESKTSTQLDHISDIERKEIGISVENCMDSFGWSMDISRYGKLLVGGPAMTAGRVMLYNNGMTTTPTLIRNKARKDGIVKLDFGYSVVYGNFLDDSPMESIAISSPYGEKGLGKVLLLRQKKWNVIQDPSAQVGSLFGAALCSAKLKAGSNRAYLLIGAPGFGNGSSSDYNRGAVHVYVPAKGRSLSKHVTIIGRDKNSFFGMAMVNVGRLDSDDSDDVAIAAPFEDDGHGAVYIYLGSDLMRTNAKVDFKQRIAPEGYRAFGLSLSALIDPTYNGSKELVIGAPGSMMQGTDQVAVVRSMGWIRIILRNEYPELQKRKDNASFVFQSCMDVTYSKKLTSVNTTISVLVNIIHQNATHDNKRNKRIYTVPITTMEPTFCKPLTVLTPVDGQYDNKIGVEVTAYQLENPSEKEGFNSAYVVLCDSSKLYVYDSKFAGNCVTEKCAPNLEANIISKLFTSDNYAIGTTESESFRINVKNTNEVAYSACVIVTVVGASIESVPSPFCQEDCGGEPNCKRVRCRPKSPIFTNQTWETDSIVLKTSTLNSANKNITVETVVRNDCSNESVTTVAQTKIVKLTSDLTGVKINGITNGGEVVALNKEQVKSTGAYLEHVYTVSNLGPTNLAETKYELSIKKYDNLTYAAPKVLKNSLPSDCEQQIKEEHDMFVAVCEVDEIKKGEKLEFSLPILIGFGDWYDILKKGDIVIKSELKLVTNATISMAWNSSVSTTLTEVKGVPWWVILLAVLIGLILLGTAIYYLNKHGLLKRRNKANLQELKREVRRQSMRRSIRESSSAKNEFSDKNALCDSKEQTEVENEIDILEEVNDGGQRPRQSTVDVHKEGGRNSVENTSI